ncbi:MAG: hypothetical protein HOV94_13455 [Saccharothrix sp.]|nr:hypothetical protein [Saccharothrix sp.]
MRLRVMHNTNRLATVFGYTPSDQVVEVYAFDYPGSGDHLEVCEVVFTLFNVGHLSESGSPDPEAVAYREGGNRSLSVGDVVGCDGRFYACFPEGWREVSQPVVTERRPPLWG